MPPVPALAGDNASVSPDPPASESEAAPPLSTARKTRIVRVRRDSNGVELSRTYADSTDESISNEKERTPLSPIKTTAMRSGRNSNGLEANQTPEDSTNHSCYNYNDQNQPSSTIKKAITRLERNSNSDEVSRAKVVASEDTKEVSTNIKEITSSPTKTRLVRVRRNSLGEETSRTYLDMNADGNSSHTSVDDTNMLPTKTRLVKVQVRRNSLGTESSRTYVNSITDGSSNHSSVDDPKPVASVSLNSDLTTSPTKTRRVRVTRNSLGIETSRTYVDAIVDGSSNHSGVADPIPITPMSSPVRNEKLTVSPVKILSPSKMISQKGKLGAKKESMKKILDGRKATSTLDATQSNAMGQQVSMEQGLSLKNPALALTSNSVVSDRVKKSSGISFVPNTASRENENPHFVASPPNRSKSATTIPPTLEDENRIQSIRLLRVLLGEESATISKDTVDRALEKHADLLRFQLQQKKKLKQKDEMIEQEKKQRDELSDNHSKEIAKIEKELKNQKMLMQTSLEVKDVEIDILKKERDQNALKVQQISWRLAKERFASKNKEAKATDTLCHLNQTTSTEPSMCVRCQALDIDDSESYLDMLNVTEPSKLADDDELSVATPIMGHSASSGMVLPGSPSPDANSGSEKSSTAELKNKLRDTEEKLITAKKSILLMETAKREIEADFEETLLENKAKNAQLKAVLVACNERRRVAEQMLRDLGQYDEAKLVAISKKPPDELVSEIINQGNSFEVKGLTKDFTECQSSPVSSTELIKHQRELDNLRDLLAKAKSHEHELKKENESLDKQNKTIQEANTELESELASLKGKMKDYEQSLEASKSQYEDKIHNATSSLQQLEAKLVAREALERQLVTVQKALQISEARYAALEANFEQVNKKHQLAVKEVNHYEKELDESKILLAQSEGMIAEYSTRLLEANNAVKKLEENVADLNAKLEGSRRTTEQSETRVKGYLMEITNSRIRLDQSSKKLEETQIALKKSELQAQEYAAKLQSVTDALHESETMAEKYLVMLEEANTTLLQSEKLTKQYDKENIKDDSEGQLGEDYSGSSNFDSDDGSAFSEDLSGKSTEDLLVLAAKRLEGLVPVEASVGENGKICSNEKSCADKHEVSQQISKSPNPRNSQRRIPTAKRNAEQDEVSSVTSTHIEDASKIAALEAELAESQLQLNDALRTIAELSSLNRKTSVSPKGDSTNETLVYYQAKVSELKERVASAETKYNEAAKKLVFLKETVLTVVDTDITL